ncbi:hypothetical protein Rhopal_007194-T1 [Rhodotorula paludigena]|uniref:DUF6534 domain-containing protein n=1 Tax=Rhodotorula paludigena TaxID=86838 RepID=A0AAV5GVZ2_9BASI|nr:hypothetical protein Rhopal_007194-T1 [Rhodotorula paludigena]
MASEWHVPALDSSVGAFLIGTLLSVYLAGVTFTQAWNYFVTFVPGDRVALVALVSGLKVIGMVHTGICCHTVYVWCVSHYGDLRALIRCPAPFAWGYVYAWRVYIVSSRRLVAPICICLIAVTQLAFASGTTWMIYVIDRKLSRLNEYRYGMAIWLVCAAAGDLLITTSLIFYLRSAVRGRNARWRPLVSSIIANTLQTNGFTTFVTLVNITLFLAEPHKAWAYILSALVSLNSRTTLKRIGTSAASHTITSVYEGEGPPGMPRPPLPSHPNDGGGRLEQHVFRSSSSRSFVEGIKITQIKSVTLNQDDSDDDLVRDLQPTPLTTFAFNATRTLARPPLPPIPHPIPSPDDSHSTYGNLEDDSSVESPVSGHSRPRTGSRWWRDPSVTPTSSMPALGEDITVQGTAL